jgi:hypothetical protein
VLVKTAALAGIATASLLLIAVPATARGSGDATSSVVVGDSDDDEREPAKPWLKPTCLVPFEFQGPLAQALHLENAVVKAACFGQPGA